MSKSTISFSIAYAINGTNELAPLSMIIFDLSLFIIFDNVMIIVWLNEFLGSIEQAGRQFKDIDEYKKNKSRIFTVIKIPTYTSDTFGKDISDMLSKNRTFSEMIVSPSVFLTAIFFKKKKAKISPLDC